MPSFTERIEINAGPDATWRVLGDLTSVKTWIPDVVEVELTDAGRVCTFADGHTQQEAISDYSPERRSYRYAIEGGLPVRDNRGSFTVEQNGGGSIVIWESSFEPLDPASERQLTEMWSGALPLILGNLKTLVEDSRR